MNQLKYLKQTTWKNVFATWKQHEGSDPAWQKFAVEERGFDSWEAWRSAQSEKVHAADLDWNIYTITNPNDFILDLLLGPFRGWQKFFEEKLQHTVQDIVDKEFDWINNHNKTKELRKNFPEKTQFIGLYLPWVNKMMLYEGHHRAAAITVAKKVGTPLVFDNLPTIALAEIKQENWKFLEALLEQGNGNPNI